MLLSANIILDLKLNWPDLIIINGRPRHPQSQGLVERSNAVVQNMLGKWMEMNNTKDWPSGLGMKSIHRLILLISYDIFMKITQDQLCLQ